MVTVEAEEEEIGAPTVLTVPPVTLDAGVATAEIGTFDGYAKLLSMVL